MILYPVAGLVLAGAEAGVLWKMTLKSQTPKRVSGLSTPESPYENVAFSNGEYTLRGWFIPALSTGDKNPIIILVHGWGSGKARMLRYVSPLREEGYSIFIFDVRSLGESDGVKAPTVKIFRDDVFAAIDYVKTRADVDPDRIGILAHSFGAFGSILANKNNTGIRALVTDSMPVRFSTIMRAALKQYKLPYYPLGPILSKFMFMRAAISSRELKELDAVQALRQRKAPVLLIHSKNDDYVPASELDYALSGQDIDHLYVESNGHRSSETDPQFWSRVLTFFQKYL
jgi:pimeloyl-ACP methyl ester carboxylesterase